MRFLAIGDIHGCSIALDRLLDAVKLQPEDIIVTLGDYVDRGPDTKGVIERLLSIHERGQLIALKGNHELMMMDARSSQRKEQEWIKIFGKETIMSYSGSESGSLRDIPKSHWNFLENICLNWWETDKYMFVHANLLDYVPLDKQSEHDLFWSKIYDPEPHYSGKTMICGHTSQKSGQPVNWGHAICIDTWACGDGWLTCLDVESGKIWQANQQGQLKTAQINDFYTPRYSWSRTFSLV